MRLAFWNSAPAGDFEEDRYGPTERRERLLAREQAWWRRHLAWIKRWPRPLQVIIVLVDIAAAYALLVIGMMLGLAVRALLF